MPASYSNDNPFPSWTNAWCEERSWNSWAKQIRCCVMKLEGLSIVGKSRARPAGKPLPAVNPANGAPLEPGYYWATHQDVASAAQLAHNAFAEYGQWNPTRRAALLRRIAELIEANAAAIIERANLETALPPGRLQSE